MASMSISAIGIIDELFYLDFIPWKESIQSVLQFSDELIAVHGGKNPGQQRTVEWLNSLNDSRIKIVYYPWPESFNWEQISRSCSFGLLHCTSDWCFRFLMDEIFPDSFSSIKKTLSNLSNSDILASVGRYYLLGTDKAYPYRHKPLFFRRDSSLGYGYINPQAGEGMMPRLYDDPIDLTKWFNGSSVDKIESLLQSKNAKERILNGETPRGHRDVRAIELPYAFLNTDVNFMTDEMIIRQKRMSMSGYPSISRSSDYLKSLETKIRQMLRSNLVDVVIPKNLRDFISKQNNINIVHKLCTDNGLRWQP